MKLRHAAALALVGWYLLVPPWVAPNQFDATAPLAQWPQVKSFDSAAACEQHRLGAFRHFSANKEKLDEAAAEYNARLYRAALCVETDDPRLGK
jgi:hypothetical protein